MKSSRVGQGKRCVLGDRGRYSRLFQDSQKEAQKKGRKPKIHKFDGTGYYAIRFRRPGAKVDGISVDDLMQGNFESK